MGSISAEADSTGAENRQVERRRVAERRLLEAAAEIIGESGPSSLTLAEVGLRAGYSRGLATHHFGSKNAMIQRLVRAVEKQFASEVKPPELRDASSELMRPIVDWYFDILRDFRPMNKARIILWADAAAHGTSEIRDEARGMDVSFRRRVTLWVEHLQEEGSCDGAVDPEGFAVAYVGMMRGIALQFLLDPSLDLSRIQREVLRTTDARLRGDRWAS